MQDCNFRQAAYETEEICDLNNIESDNYHRNVQIAV